QSLQIGADVAASGDGGYVMEGPEPFAFRERLQHAQCEGGAAYSSAGKRQSPEGTLGKFPVLAFHLAEDRGQLQLAQQIVAIVRVGGCRRRLRLSGFGPGVLRWRGGI